MQLARNVSLARYNTFGVAVRARRFAVVAAAAGIEAALEACAHSGPAPLWLGRGSNVLLRGDLDRVVLINRLTGITRVDQDHDHVYVRAAAGEHWHDLVRHTLTRGWAGLENLSLIPGTVGAAPVQNIGAYGVELASLLQGVEARDLATGLTHRFDVADCGFGYRTSHFKTRWRDRYLITAITVRLPRRPQWHTGYAGIRAALAARGEPPLSAPLISDIVAALRAAKLPDPAQLGNAGSFFKNPLVPRDHATSLGERHPGLPVYPQNAVQSKLSAAWLIEQCGWKGYRDGDAGVYPGHALVLVNYGAASGAELWRLAQAIQDSVQKRFAVALEPEPLIL